MPTLLLADDSITVQRVVALMFAAEDVRVVAASNGSEAVERMSTDRPDVVLAATTLPGMTGYDLSRYVKDQKTLRGVPVLLMSGAFEAVDEARLEASGAAGIVEKPIEPTTVISRVKELLGLKSDQPAPVPPGGRLVTPAGGPRDRKPGAPGRPAGSAPTGPGPKTAPPGDRSRPLTPPPGRPAPPAPRAPASTWDELRRDTLEPDARSVESSRQSGDVLDSLGDAFDSLDAQLSGRPVAQKTPQGRAPIAPAARGVSAKDGGSPVYEVDDDWFSGADRTDQARVNERRELAAEMGIHDLELPESETAPASPKDLDFDFGIDATTTKAEEARRAIDDDLRAIESHDLAPPTPSPATAEMTAEIADLKSDLVADPVPAAPPQVPARRAPKGASSDAIADLLGSVPKRADAPEKPVPKPEPVVASPPPPVVPPPPPMPVAVAPPPPPAPPPPAPPPAPAPVATVAPPLARPVVAPPIVVASGPPVADAFDALLAFEQGDPRGLKILAPEPPPPPEITAEMLDEIATKVAARLGEGALGEQLRQALTQSVRDTVRDVVSSTSERVVRDTVREVVAATSERVIRETVQQVVGETSERVAREVLVTTAERVAREVLGDTAERVAREVLGNTADHVAREVLSSTAERVAREVLPATAERVAREVLPAASERVAREVLAETSERVVREVVSETAERAVRDAVAATAERLVRQVVSDTSERLVRDEIQRIRGQAEADDASQE